MRITPLHRFTDHSAAIYGLSPGRSEDTVFTASGDRHVVEWNLRTLRQEPFAVRLEHPAYCVRLLPEQELLLAGNSVGGLHVIDVRERREIRYLLQHSQGIFDIRYDAVREQLLVAGGDGVMSVWSVPAFELLVALPLSTSKLRQLALDPSGSSIALAAGDGTVRLLDPHFFNEAQSLARHEGGATSVVFHPEKPVVVSGGKDAWLRVHRLDDGSEVLAFPAHRSAIYRIAFSPHHRWCATASRDKTIKLWDAATLDPLARLEARTGGHSHSVNDLWWWKDDHFLSCGDDRQLILWQVHT